MKKEIQKEVKTEMKVIEFPHTKASVDLQLKQIIKVLPKKIEHTDLKTMSLVDEVVKKVVKFSNQIKANAKSLRDENTQKNKLIISLETDVLLQTDAQKTYLKGLQEKRDKALVLEERRKLIPQRREQIKGLYDITDEYLLEYNDEQWERLVYEANKKKLEHEKMEMEKEKAYQEGQRKASAEYKEEMRLAEIEREKERKAEEEMLEEKRIKKEKEDKERQEEEDKKEAKRIKALEESIKKENERIAKEKKEEDDRQALIVKKEKEAMDKVKNKVNEEIDRLKLDRDNVKVEKEGKIIKIYQLVAEIKI